MSEKQHIEYLRDKLAILKADAPWLYRYGEFRRSTSLFQGLSAIDQRRFLALAARQKDQDVKEVAARLLSTLDPPVSDFRQLLAQLPNEERDEVTACFHGGVARSMTKLWEERIMLELQHAVSLLGERTFESAYWIAIPDSNRRDSVWIDAIGDKNQAPLPGTEVPTALRYVPGEVLYDPDDATRDRLLALMRNCLWTLHIHNHTGVASFVGTVAASPADQGFAKHWRSLRPELAEKMKFFVVYGESVAEYDEGNAVKRLWIEQSAV